MDIEKKDRYIPPGLRDQPFPTPRGPRKRAPSPPSRTPDSIRELFKNNSQVEILPQQTGFTGGPQSKRRGYRLALWSWMASFIDGLILISISCVFLLVFSFVLSHSGLGKVHLRNSEEFQKIFFSVFLLCSWVYMVVLRVLMGSSVGEWACDLRVGQPHERMKVQYPLRIIARESLILLTGVVTLPTLSLICGRDLPGKLAGVQLFSLK